MGLDMYLYKAKRFENVTAKELKAMDKYFSYVTRPNEYRNDTPQDWCGLDMDDVNLDLVGKYITEYTPKHFAWDKEKKYGGFKTIFEQTGYWRKANQVHSWFVEHVQNGIDDCGFYEVSKEQLKDLLSVCKQVLDGVEASELLPTKQGFFFGGSSYDKWYYEDVQATVEIIEKVIATTDFKREIIIYHSSW